MAGRSITRKATNKSKSFSPKAAAVAPKPTYVQSVWRASTQQNSPNRSNSEPNQNKGYFVHGRLRVGEVTISAFTATHYIEIESKN